MTTDAMNKTHKDVSPQERKLTSIATNNFIDEERSFRDRGHALAATIVDLTHDTMPEKKW